MTHENPFGPTSVNSIIPRVEMLAHQLQGILDKLKINAEHLSGDIFNSDVLFEGADCARLDEKLAEVIEELKFLSRGIDE